MKEANEMPRRDAGAVRKYRTRYLGIISALVASSILLTPPAGASEGEKALLQLPVGTSSSEIGVTNDPNQECQGPAAITGTKDGKLAILDAINNKISIIESQAITDIHLSNSVVGPQDFASVGKGFLVVGAYGDVSVVDPEGKELAHTRIKHDPEAGVLRIVPTASNTFAVEELNGSIVDIPLATESIGGIEDIGVSKASGYVGKPVNSNKYSFENTSMAEPLREITVESNMRIVTARVIWAGKDGALIAVQEARRLPTEASFVRMVKVDAEGKMASAAYLTADAYACNTARPFARTTQGDVFSLSYRGDGGLALKRLTFFDISTSPPPEAEQAPTSATLIAEDDDVLKKLERMNGTTDAGLVSLDAISTSEIISRARAALSFRWKLAEQNYSHHDIDNICTPPEKIWKRPQRLDGQLGNGVSGVPYRWGGYLPSLGTFTSLLSAGRLAGNVCTCRNANCVNPQTAGFDCSGFVSYAWRTGRYFTTTSLPNKNVSSAVAWSDIKAGDIVNRYRSHVRLVESVSSGKNGVMVTVIESTVARQCGGVCRSTYLQDLLQKQGYKPYRRLNLADH